MNFQEQESAQKLRGGYYTPIDLAVFLARWVCAAEPQSILEPSCGDGVFLEALARCGLPQATAITGLELDRQEAAIAGERARALNLLGARIEPGDFLAWSRRALDGGQRFDAVVGNPPFIRYQYLSADFQLSAEQLFRQLGQTFTRHTNAWVPFILASIALLRPGGRMAMVVPAEIVHVAHAQPLRTYLGRECRRIVIVDPEKLWFPATLQGAVLLLAEKRDGPADAAQGIGMHAVRDREFLRLDPEAVFRSPRTINGKAAEGKWTRALLDVETRDLVEELGDHPQIRRFSDVAEVDVGIVTGANKYFLVTDETVESYKLHRWVHPMFGRSGHCPGVIYDARQHRENARNGHPTNFVWFRDGAVSDHADARAYIKLGEQQALQTRYKCRVRSPWYCVPSVYATSIGMLKRCHDAPRLILNRAGAYTTDTAYRIRSTVNAKALVVCFVNPLTALSAELEGRHYGGGVLELVPSEIERLLVPLPAKVPVDLAEMDGAVRSLPAEAVLSLQGKRVLDRIGLSCGKQEIILAAWRRLRDRRQRRRSQAAAEMRGPGAEALAVVEG